MAADAVFSAITTKIGGGSWGDALKAASISLVKNEAFDFVGDHFSGTSPFAKGENVLAHGLVGGTSSAVSGGKFWSGFAGAAVGDIGGFSSANLGKTGQLLTTSIGGGISSALTGGKFVDGMVSSASGLMFNQWQHDLARVMMSTLNGREYDLQLVKEGILVPDPSSRLGAYQATLGYKSGTVGYAANRNIARIYLLFGSSFEENIGTYFNLPASKALFPEPINSPANRLLATGEYNYWKSIRDKNPWSVGGFLGSLFSPDTRTWIQKKSAY